MGLISALPTSMKNPITALRPAAQYLRMSTELQKYSLANQSAAIAEYARVEGFEIVRSFEDAGISGVTTKKRVGLATMLSEVVAGSADFEAILVLDVSRWGRYQDADESAHYEFMCRQAGVPIHYCGERFGNDFTSPIMKQIKRVMAGEYSRDLSVKVRRGKRRMAEGGYAQGGGCPFGLQRREFHADGSPGRLLARSQRKSNPGYTVRFEKGLTREVGVVLRIFRSYVHERLDAGLIANALNADRQMWHDGSRWTSGRVRNVLTCDLLVGVQGYAKTARVLGHDAVLKPRSEWKFTTVGPPIVPSALFKNAQKRRAVLSGSYGQTDEELLVDLRKVLASEGKLSRTIIEASKLCPHSSTYAERFGGMLNTYKLIGYARPKLTKGRDSKGQHISRQEMIEELRRLSREVGRVTSARIEADNRVPSLWSLRKVFGSVTEACAAAGVEGGRLPARLIYDQP